MDKFDNENRKVQYYADGKFSDEEPFKTEAEYNRSLETGRSKKHKIPSYLKAVIIIALVILSIIIFTVSCGAIADDNDPSQVSANFGHDYIGVLYVTDTIDEYGSGTYNHQYVLNAIDAMIADSENKGMILYVDTPGGSVYASDELYLKIKEYQDTTKRPVYSSMQSMAASGGYYISAPCDKIIANRNCWTGSIGVTMGTFVDISGLLSDLGIKTQTITSGANKAMGSTTEPMTDEQRAIFQSLIDEAYEQFVGIVADGRNMSEEEVRVIADGRIYSAAQALENGLIDAVGTFEEAVGDMISEYKLGDISVESFQPETKTDLSSLLGILAKQSGKASITDAEAIEQLIRLNGTFRVSYISNITKYVGLSNICYTVN